MKLNQIQAIGRIGKDAVIHDYQGKKFLAFSLAIDESYKNSEGTKVERVTFYDCTTEQERFFKIASWLTKGREILVEGKPSVRTYEKDGKAYGAIKIQIANISLGSSPHDERPVAAGQAPQTARPAATTAAVPFPAEAESDDLPF
ncbi:single-stranded DNA-binding protein [Spirosoma litoris]